MRKRRVGVTARSRQNVGNQVTGTLQFDTEMAAPLELRTPAGTLRQRLQTECGWKHGDKGAGKSTGRETIKQNMQREREEEVRRRKSAPKARMRRCLKLGQGAKPPETPAPFPSGWRIQNGDEGKGAFGQAGEHYVYGKGNRALRAHEALPQTPPGGEPHKRLLKDCCFVADALFCWHGATIFGACGTGRLDHPFFVFAGGVAAESPRVRCVDACTRNRWTGCSLANSVNPHRQRLFSRRDFAASSAVGAW